MIDVRKPGHGHIIAIPGIQCKPSKLDLLGFFPTANKFVQVSHRLSQPKPIPQKGGFFT